MGFCSGKEGSARRKACWISGKSSLSVVVDFWQPGMIAITRTARSVNKSLNFGIARCKQHVDEPVDIIFVGADGIGHRARPRSQSSLVQDEIHSRTESLASRQIADIT